MIKYDIRIVLFLEMYFMKTQRFQNKKVLISIIIAQILIILVWLGYLSFFTRYKYRVVGFNFGYGLPYLASKHTITYGILSSQLFYVLGIQIYPGMTNPGYLIFKTHIFISLPILLLYRIWIYGRLNSEDKKNLKNLQFAFISLSTLLLFQTLTQFLLFKKIFPVIDETTNSFPVYIWRAEYNDSFENLATVAISQANILFISGAILYFTLLVSIIKTIIIPYIQKKIYLKKNMKEIVTEHEKLITNLKN